jgi:hypothetical protein
VAGGRGLRPIAEHPGVPHTTARTSWRRFRVCSPTMVTWCTALAVSVDGTAVMLSTTGERAALDALGVAWHRPRFRFGDRVGRAWAFWSRISGGSADTPGRRQEWIQTGELSVRQIGQVGSPWGDIAAILPA